MPLSRPFSFSNLAKPGGGIVFLLGGTLLALFIALSLYAIPSNAADGINNQINYQARLMDASGFPVSDGTYSIIFSLYDAPTGGNRVWTAGGTIAAPTAVSVSVENGLFTVLLGEAGQNSLDSVNWNQDGLYLGVTINADSEMTPRKRLASAPQAFNSRQLQGMYASSTAFGANSLFTINQTSNTSATGTRTALEVRSSGTSNANDYLIQGINDLGATVFSLNRQGNVSADGLLTVNGSGTSTFSGAVSSTQGEFSLGLTVGGTRVCLSDGTDCTATTTPSFQDVTNVGQATTKDIQFNGGTSTGDFTVNTLFTVLGNSSLQNVTFADATGTNTTSTNLAVTGVVSSDLLPSGDLAYSLGSISNRWNAYLGDVTTTNAYVSSALGFNSATGSELTLMNPIDPTSFGSISTTGTAMDVSVSNGYAYVADLGQGLQIFNVNNPANPIYVSGTTLGVDEAWKVIVQGKYAYVAYTNNGLIIYDVSDPAAPTEVGAYGTSCRAIGVYVSGRYAYLGCDANGFQIIDVSDPTAPSLAGSIASTSTRGIYVQGRYAYIADGSNGIKIIDVSNPQSPVQTGSALTIGAAGAISVSGRYAYVTEDSAFTVFDVANAADPIQVARATLGTTTWDLDVSGNYAYVGNFGDGLKIFDISDPTNPVLASSLDLGANLARGVYVSGKHAYVAESAVLRVVDLRGADLNAARIGSIQVGSGTVLSDFEIGNNLFVRNSLNLGLGGLFSDGGIGVGPGTTSTFEGTVSTTQLYVSNQLVCLADGTNCAPGADANWTYNATSDFIRPTTSTTDIVLGNTVTSTGAAAYYDLSGGDTGSSNIYFGFATNTNVVIGGTSTTVSHMNSLFALNGDDLYVGGNIGSASSIYTNGEFVAGPGSTHYGNGLISKTDGDLIIASTSGTSVVNALEQLITSSFTPEEVARVTGIAKATQFAVSGRYAYVVGGANTFHVVDLSDPAHPTSTGYTTVSGTPTDVEVDGRYVYVGTGLNDVAVYDVSDKTNPVLVRTISGSGQKLSISGHYLFGLAASSFTVTDLSNDQVIFSLSLGGFTGAQLKVQGSYAYAITSGVSNDLSVIDISNPAVPSLVGSYSLPNLNDLEVDGRYAYITDPGNSALYILDVGNPNAIQSVSTTTVPTASAIFVSGRYAYVTNGGGIEVLDVSSSTTPTVANTFSVTDGTSQVQTYGRYALITGGGTPTGYLAVYDMQGTELQSLTAHSADFGTARIAQGLLVNGDVNVVGGLRSGIGGILSYGGISILDIQATSSFAGAVSSSRILVNGTDVCLADGTNCAASGSDINWTYNATSDFIRPTTSTTDIVLGSTATSTGAPAYFDLSGGTDGTSSFYFGYATNSNVVIGGTSTTVSHMNSLFALNGDDLYVGGNIGSASSIYTNGEFVAGPGSTHYGNGLISKTDGVLNINATGGVTFDHELTVNGTGTSTFAGAVSSTQFIANPGDLSNPTYTFSGLTDTGMYAVASNLQFSVGGTRKFYMTNSTNVSAQSLGPSNNLIQNLGSNTTRWATVYGGDGSFSGTATTTGLDVTGNVKLGDGSSDLITVNGRFTSDLLPVFGTIPSIGDVADPWDGYFRNVTSTNLFTMNGGVTALPPSTFYPDRNIIGLSPQLQQSVNMIVNDRSVYLVTPSGGFQKLDVSDPTAPYLSASSTLAVGSTPKDFDIDENRLVVAGNNGTSGGNGIQVYLIGASAPLQTSDFVFTSSTSLKIDLGGRYAYVTGQASSSLYVVDLVNPGEPILAKTVTGIGAPNDVTVSGRYAYVTDNSGNNLYVIDILNPTDAHVVGTLALANAPGDVVVQGSYAYVSYSAVTQYSVVDISDPTNPTIVTSQTCAGVACTGSHISGDYLVQKGYYSLDQKKTVRLVDISSSSTPSITSELELIDAPPENIEFLSRQGSYVYLLQRNTPFSAPTSVLSIIDTGGVKTDAINAASAELGDLTVRTDGLIGKSLDVKGSLTIGSGLHSFGAASISADNSGPALSVSNIEGGTTGTNWGAYIDQLLVGDNGAATGTLNYQMLLSYTTGTTFGGLCIDNTLTGATCPTNVGGASIVAEGSVLSNAFDIAEYYNVSGPASDGDLLVLDSLASSTVKMSAGQVYDPKIIGIASTDPGFVLGWSGGVRVALSGRVPTKVSPYNGEIHVGDPLTSSPYPGYAMKATKPGMIVGYALEEAFATSTIESFVDVGYYANATLKTDGTLSYLSDDLTIDSSMEASSSVPAVDSYGFTFRGKAWDNASSTVVTHEFTLVNDVLSATSSALSVLNTNQETIFSLSQAGDLSIAGKLFPSLKGGGAQSDWYVFVDDTLGASSTYLSTNAAGWQSLDTYDFAERYYSPDALEPGDLVALKRGGGPHVQRSLDADQAVLGIVSTQPAFIAGRPDPEAYPVALSGRVPTKVSTMNGDIQVGDPLGPSSIPGVAVKRVTNGPIVGMALEDYSDGAIGKIEVYVNPGWWGGASNSSVAETGPSRAAVQGFAQIFSGQTRVHVSFDSIGAYPNVQATKQAQISGDWWTEGYTDTGFDIVLLEPQPRDVVFSWTVTPSISNDLLYLSSGEYSVIDPLTGQPVNAPDQDSGTPTEPAQTSQTTEASIPTASTSGTDSTISTDPLPQESSTGTSP